MPVPSAVLQPSGGLPKIEIIIGHRHFAKFEFFIYDQNDRNPVKFAVGDNSDNVPDVFEIGAGNLLATLDKRALFWQAAVASFTSTAGENYSVIVRVLQDGIVVGTDSKIGPMSDPIASGFLRLFLS